LFYPNETHYLTRLNFYFLRIQTFYFDKTIGIQSCYQKKNIRNIPCTENLDIKKKRCKSAKAGSAFPVKLGEACFEVKLPGRGLDLQADE
jgi:hypothetical protein